jgi:hypothetical protein
VKRILIDAGPIVAFFDESESTHQGVCEYYSSFRGRLVTTYPVITEAAWKLGELDINVRRELYDHLKVQK